jgi:hypothetical protein
MDLHTIAGTLRSAGARLALTTGFYKHLAPLEPELAFVAGFVDTVWSGNYYSAEPTSTFA